uniref:Secreted protein n=1 Tax=Ditylenchus dipsaci TaxID=166011 RepID=A0A915DLH9_9BILA
MANNALVSIALCSLMVALCLAASLDDTTKVDPAITKEIVTAEIAAIKAVPSSNPKVQKAIDTVVQMMEKDMNENNFGQNVWNVYDFLYNNTSPDALDQSEISQVETIILNASKQADIAKNISVPVTDADAE